MPMPYQSRTVTSLPSTRRPPPAAFTHHVSRITFLLSIIFASTLPLAHTYGAEDRSADVLPKELSKSDIVNRKSQIMGTSARWAKPEVAEVLPGVWRVRFGKLERFTPSAVRQASARVEGFKALPTPTPLPFKPAQIRCRISSSRTTVYIPCEESGQQIYGFGLDPGAYQQKGLCKTLTVCAGVMGQTGASHGPVPFYLSTKGYGVYVDTARVPVVQVARLTPNQSAATNEADSDPLKTSEAELYAARPARGRAEVIVDLPGDSTGVEVYVFAGPTMREAVQRYNLFSGGGAVPPLCSAHSRARTRRWC